MALRNSLASMLNPNSTTTLSINTNFREYTIEEFLRDDLSPSTALNTSMPIDKLEHMDFMDLDISTPVETDGKIDSFWERRASFHSDMTLSDKNLQLKPEIYLDDSHNFMPIDDLFISRPNRSNQPPSALPNEVVEDLMRNVPIAATTSDSKEWKCFAPDCDKVYGTGPGLRYHMVHFHKCKIPIRVQPKERPQKRREWKCGRCNKTYSSKGGFKYHVKTQHTEIAAYVNRNIEPVLSILGGVNLT